MRRCQLQLPELSLVMAGDFLPLSRVSGPGIHRAPCSDLPQWRRDRNGPRPLGVSPSREPLVPLLRVGCLTWGVSGLGAQHGSLPEAGAPPRYGCWGLLSLAQHSCTTEQVPTCTSAPADSPSPHCPDVRKARFHFPEEMNRQKCATGLA